MEFIDGLSVDHMLKQQEEAMTSSSQDGHRGHMAQIGKITAGWQSGQSLFDTTYDDGDDSKSDGLSRDSRCERIATFENKQAKSLTYTESLEGRCVNTGLSTIRS